jgi:hypothetical protein
VLLFNGFEKFKSIKEMGSFKIWTHNIKMYQCLRHAIPWNQLPANTKAEPLFSLLVATSIVTVITSGSN